MLWRNTQRIGCAIATSYGTCPAGFWVPQYNTRWTGFMLVCEYDPPGNYPDFDKNVFRPIAPTITCPRGGSRGRSL